VKVSADGTGLASRAGTPLLREPTIDAGLAAGWAEALPDTYRAAPSRHLPGRVPADPSVMIAGMPQPAANRQEDTTHINNAQVSGGAKDRG